MRTLSEFPLLERIWGLRKGRRLASVVLRRLRLSRFFTIKTNGVKLRFHPAVWPINLWENPDTFNGDTSFFRRYLRAGDIVVDCGANVGLLSLVASDVVGERGVIFSFEAHPRIYSFLLENIRLNVAGNIRPYNLAVGEREGSITFSNEITDDGNHVVREGDGIRVGMRTLDDILSPDLEIALLKLDVEGYEKFVLEGAPRVLRGAKCVYFELSKRFAARYGYECSELLGMLANEGFSLFRVVATGALEAINVTYNSDDIENLVALRDPSEFAARTGESLKEAAAAECQRL